MKVGQAQIYTFCGWRAASEADSPSGSATAAHMGGQVLKWLGKISQLGRSFTNTAMRRVSRKPVHTVLLFYAIVVGSGKQTLQSVEHPLTQQSKTGSSEHHPFDELNSRHLSLRLPIAVNKR